MPTKEEREYFNRLRRRVFDGEDPTVMVVPQSVADEFHKAVSRRLSRQLMRAAHDSDFARKVGVPQSVAEEFHEADERKQRRRKRRDFSLRKEKRYG